MLKLALGINLVGICLYIGYVVYESKSTEQLEYKVLRTSPNGIELREYSPFVVAEIDVMADNQRDAASLGFRPLAGYIFGDNVPNEKISMTAPVTTQAASGENISMAAPVTATEKNDGLFTVRFSMPSTWTIKTLPEPINNQIRLVQTPVLMRLAQKNRGKSNATTIQKATDELLDHCRTTGARTLGGVIWAGYSSPFIVKPLRRWEVMVNVESIK